jgi:hypothetical protein
MDEDETTPPHMNEIFNAHLLDEEALNNEIYVGEKYSDDSDNS